MAPKRRITLKVAIEGKQWSVVARYAAQHGKYRGWKATYILPLLLTFVNPILATGVTSVMLFEQVLEFLGIDPNSLIKDST